MFLNKIEIERSKVREAMNSHRQDTATLTDTPWVTQWGISV